MTSSIPLMVRVKVTSSGTRCGDEAAVVGNGEHSEQGRGRTLGCSREP
jgi:hypothetical protein